MRLHVVSLPHTQVTRAYDWCAYTAKVRRLGGMLRAHGHEAIIYSYGDCDADATHVDLGDPEHWNVDDVFGDWQPASERWTRMNMYAIAAIKRNWQGGDAIGIIAGLCQAWIADAFPNQPILEWGVGYDGTLSNSFRAFESHAWQHYVAGIHQDNDGHFFDTVIPNAFNPEDFDQSNDRQDYFLYLGRLTPRKGLAIVEEFAKRYNVVTAGQGDIRIAGAKHLGVILGRQKREVLSQARAVLVPTTYLEPFGGVAVEAMLSGVPVITTDFGAFPETVAHGVSGYRCSMLKEFLWAAERVDDLNPTEILKWATQFTTSEVAKKYDTWLQRIGTLHGDGWYDV